MTSNVVPGIDFSNDPLLQGRNFSYNDTQLSRLGSTNFHEIPINRPVCPFSNNQREAHMRIAINKGRVSYAPSSLDGRTIEEVGAMQRALKAENVLSEIVAPHVGEINGDGGVTEAMKTFANSSSVLFDAVY